MAIVGASSGLLLLLLAQEPAPATACMAIERQVATGDLPAARAGLTRLVAELLRADRAETDGEYDLLQRVGNAALEAADEATARRLFEHLTQRLAADGTADTVTRWRAQLGLSAAILAGADFATARATIEHDLAAFAESLPKDGIELANGQVQLSRALRRLGESKASLELARTAEATLSRVLGDEGRSVLVARMNVAEALLDCGQVQAAVAIAQPTCDALAGVLPEAALELGISRAILGRILLRLGALVPAMSLFERTLATFGRVLPPDHVHLLQACLNVANGLSPQDPRRLELTTRALEGARRSLGDEHFYTQNARIGVAGTHAMAGSWREALPLANEAARILTRDHPRHGLTLIARLLRVEVLDHLERTSELQQQRAELLLAYEARLPPEHPEVQSARVGLALAQRRRGDLTGAAVTLERAVALLPHGEVSPNLAVAILRPLAIVRTELGDLPAALLLRERVVELLEAASAPTADLVAARQELAVLHCNFDGARALELQQAVVRALEDDDLADPLELARALANLAAMKAQFGDLSDAVELQRRVVGLHGLRPADDPLRLRAVGNLAESLGRSGDSAAAVERLREVVAGWERINGGEFEAAVARSNLAWWLAQTGDAEGALPLATTALDAIAATGHGTDLAVPDCLRRATWIAIRCMDRQRATELVRRWAAEVRQRMLRSSLSPRESAGWLEYHDDVVDTLVSMALGTGGLAADPSLVGEFVATVECVRGGVLGQGRTRWQRLPPALRDELGRLEDDLRATATEVAASARSGAGLRAAVEANDRAERAHAAALQRAAGDSDNDRSAAELFESLPQHAGAAALRACTPLRPDGAPAGPRLLVAAVAGRSGAPRLLILGELAKLEAMAADLERKGMRSSAWVALRTQVIDPLRAALPGVEELHLAAEGVLQCVPWDALELADGRLVGECLRIHLVTSLRELRETPAPPAAQPERLLLCGGIDYGSASAASAIEFAPLPATRGEIAAVAGAFTGATPATEVLALTALEPQKARVMASMQGCSHVHLATHGYFVSTPVTAPGTHAKGAVDDAVARLAPQALCGIALADANSAADESGRHPGIATAQELAAVDLTACELVVLSACEGSAGFEVRGRGVASLRTALRAAGARYVVAASWRVSDDATRTLMEDFYTCLLLQPADRRNPHAALWHARMAAKRRKVSFRDWAGWSVIGR